MRKPFWFWGHAACFGGQAAALSAVFQKLESPYEEKRCKDAKAKVKDKKEEFGNEVIVTSRLNLKQYKELCEETNWKYRRVEDIIGAQSTVLITIGLPSHRNLEEILSRARNKLIVVTEEKR